jgi:hypothetical protein
VTNVDTVAEWEASRALKDAVDALRGDMLRSLQETGRAVETASIFVERLERLMQASGLPIGVAMKVAFGSKSISIILGALESAGLPPGALAEIRAAVRQSPGRVSPAAQDRAAALALVPAIPLPERFEDPAAALALVPAISLPEHCDGAGEPPAAVEAAACASEGPAHTEHTEEAAGAAETHARAPEAPPDGDERAEATMRTVARAAAAIGITPTDDDLRIAARVVDHLRAHADGFAHRAARLRDPIRRRPRASRAPRRAAHRSAVAPARDGPPADDDAPPPVASRSPRSAIVREAGVCAAVALTPAARARGADREDPSAQRSARDALPNARSFHSHHSVIQPDLVARRQHADVGAAPREAHVAEPTTDRRLCANGEHTPRWRPVSRARAYSASTRGRPTTSGGTKEAATSMRAACARRRVGASSATLALFVVAAPRQRIDRAGEPCAAARACRTEPRGAGGWR